MHLESKEHTITLPLPQCISIVVDQGPCDCDIQCGLLLLPPLLQRSRYRETLGPSRLSSIREHPSYFCLATCPSKVQIIAHAITHSGDYIFLRIVVALALVAAYRSCSSLKQVFRTVFLVPRSVRHGFALPSQTP